MMMVIKDEVLLTVSCPIFPSILIAKNLLTGNCNLAGYLFIKAFVLIHVLKEQLGGILFISFVIVSVRNCVR
jgi:hypothetical protein